MDNQPSMSKTESVLGAVYLEDLPQAAYKITSIPGRGRGLVAKTNIPRGYRILVETPILVVESTPPPSLEPIIAAKLKRLSKAEQRQFLSLSNNFPGKYPFSGIVKTNALPCGSGSSTGGVYGRASLINHSCVPNAHNNWNADSGQETIHATRPISSGEEITICYSKGGTSVDRRIELRQAFGFDCDCSLCSLLPNELEASNTRRQKCEELDDAIGNPFRIMRDPNASLADCKMLLGILITEHGDSGLALFARLYYDAFQICIAHSDQVRAAMFAKRAYEARILCEGEDSPLTSKMKILMEAPANHQTFAAYSSRWRSKKNSLPQGIDSATFDKWLWRIPE